MCVYIPNTNYICAKGHERVRELDRVGDRDSCCGRVFRNDIAETLKPREFTSFCYNPVLIVMLFRWQTGAALLARNFMSQLKRFQDHCRLLNPVSLYFTRLEGMLSNTNKSDLRYCPAATITNQKKRQCFLQSGWSSFWVFWLSPSRPRARVRPCLVLQRDLWRRQMALARWLTFLFFFQEHHPW